MKRMISLLVTAAMLVSCVPVAMATGTDDYADKKLAVIAKGTVDMHNTMTIDGSVYTTGEIWADNSGGNNVNGSLISPIATDKGYKYYTGKHKFTTNYNTVPTVSGGFKTDSTVTYAENVLDPLFTVPTLSGAKHYDTLVANQWGSTGSITINQDTSFGTLTLQGNGLIVDLSKGDVTMVVNKLTLPNSFGILVSGTSGNTHKLNLYVNQFDGAGGQINNNGDSSRVNVYLTGIMNFSNASIAANVYIAGSDATITSGATIHGHVVTNAKTASVTGNAKVYGVVYAPNAATTVSNSGRIEGQLVTSSLDISGSGYIGYAATAVTDFDTNVKSLVSEAPTVEAPIIITQPSSLAAHVGDAAKLSVEASVTKGNLSYQWYSSSSNSTNDGIAINEATSATYAPSTTAAGTTYYYCVITNTVGKIVATTTSSIISTVVTVNSTPAVDYSKDLIPNNDPATPNLVGKLCNDYAYIYGKSDTTMGPEDSIIRCEASALLYRLLKQNGKLDGFSKPSNSSFQDIKGDEWYSNALEFMTYIGVYNKDTTQDSVFAYRPITRGEAAKLFAFSMGIKSSDNVCNFTDLDASNRYYKYINAMVAGGYMQGDKGVNTIRPNDEITRAEFVVIYNSIVGRDSYYDYTTDVNGNTVTCPYTDLDPGAWYYKDMMRAAFSYTDGKVDPSKRLDRNALDMN